MYESPLFLAAHDEESGGRSVPTTPLQVAAPGLHVSVLSRDCLELCIFYYLFINLTHLYFNLFLFVK